MIRKFLGWVRSRAIYYALFNHVQDDQLSFDFGDPYIEGILSESKQ